MANLEKIHELKLDDDVLRSSINGISQALLMLESIEVGHRINSTKAALAELLAHLTPHLED